MEFNYEAARVQKLTTCDVCHLDTVRNHCLFSPNITVTPGTSGVFCGCDLCWGRAVATAKIRWHFTPTPSMIRAPGDDPRQGYSNWRWMTVALCKDCQVIGEPPHLTGSLAGASKGAALQPLRNGHFDTNHSQKSPGGNNDL